MSKAVTTSRHRADIPAKTPLSHLSDAVSANAGTIGRRGAVIAATGGLIVTMGLPASATEAHDNAPVKDHHATKSASQQVVANNAALNVPAAKKTDAKKADAKSAESVGLKFKAEAAPEPAPEPEPEPEPATTTTQTADDTTTATTAGDSDSSASDESTSDSSTTTASSSSSSSSSSASSTPSSSKGGSIVSIAARYTGVPYVYGGTSPSGWDCSGYVSYVYAQAGINIPRSSSGIRAAGTVVSASEARPGDIIWHPGHVGIYAGNGTMYDAGSPSSGTSHRSYSWMGNVTFLRF